MTFRIEEIIEFIFNNTSLLYIESFSLIAKVYILWLLIAYARKAKYFHKSLWYLLGIVIGASVVNLSWIVTLCGDLFSIINTHKVNFIIQIAWGFNILLLICLGLLLESLSTKEFQVNILQRIFAIFNFSIMAALFGIAVFYFQETYVCTFSEILMRISLIVTLLPLLFALWHTWRLNIKQYPRILYKQLKLLSRFLVAPYLAVHAIDSIFLLYNFNNKEVDFNLNTISTPLLTAVIFYTIKKILRLRFLNFSSHVQELPKTSHFIEDFRRAVEQLSHARNVSELDAIVRQFFSEAFELLPTRSQLYIRSAELRSPNTPKQLGGLSSREQAVEKFIDKQIGDKTYLEVLKEVRILITDDLAFSNFYENDTIRSDLVTFLEANSFDVFLPIFEGSMLLGYIIIERLSRPERFYSESERDEMLVFVRYLSSMINLLENRNLNLLIKKEKELREELYSKHQEIAQFKESMRTFLRSAQYRSIGIVLYKNRKFSYLNEIAKDMLEVDLNRDTGDFITQRVSQLAHQVETYKTTQSTMVTDSRGERLVLTALSHAEHHSVIITVHYPEIADMVRSQIELLKNPSEWDYLLYLETTQSGQIINKMLPGSSGPLLNFKVELLKAALSPKAVLLNLPEDDLLPTAEIIHHISMRQLLHVFSVQPYLSTTEVASAIFGLNTLIQEQPQQQRPLLEKLDKIGTLCIQNIHLLDRELQEQLAEFIQYGYFRPYRSDHRIFSDVRIICSTNQDLSSLVASDRFSRALLEQLRETMVTLPSLLNLSQDDMEVLVEGFTQQAVASRTYKNLLELSPKERHKLIADRPISVQEFRKKVLYRLVDKSRKSAVYEEAQFDPAYSVSDPALAEAARFGKKALKDPRIMGMLWNKFQNQNKIALFLGVNRSSINRRLKEFNITQSDA
jgi:transcriptional regulator with PAS, ATPase and Fis domain